MIHLNACMRATCTYISLHRTQAFATAAIQANVKSKGTKKAKPSEKLDVDMMY